MSRGSLVTRNVGNRGFLKRQEQYTHTTIQYKCHARRSCINTVHYLIVRQMSYHSSTYRIVRLLLGEDEIQVREIEEPVRNEYVKESGAYTKWQDQLFSIWRHNRNDGSPGHIFKVMLWQTIEIKCYLNPTSCHMVLVHIRKWDLQSIQTSMPTGTQQSRLYCVNESSITETRVALSRSH